MKASGHLRGSRAGEVRALSKAITIIAFLPVRNIPFTKLQFSSQGSRTSDTSGTPTGLKTGLPFIWPWWDLVAFKVWHDLLDQLGNAVGLDKKQNQASPALSLFILSLFVFQRNFIQMSLFASENFWFSSGSCLGQGAREGWGYSWFSVSSRALFLHVFLLCSQPHNPRGEQETGTLLMPLWDRISI